jgi:uncharacterized protein (TIGR02145 family)
LTQDPIDAGLYFKHGSVAGIFSAGGGYIQWLPGNNTDTFSPDDVAWSPIAISGSGEEGWANVPSGDAVDITDAYHTIANVKAGKGDPCRLVGLNLTKIKNTPAGSLTEADIDNHTWRLPTLAENRTFSGTDGGLPTQTSAHWTSIYGEINGGQFYTADKFLPAAGYRDNSGTVTEQGQKGRYWSMEYNSRLGGPLFLSFYQSGIFATAWDENSGYSIRCVRQ